MGQAIFNYTAWLTRYPEFTTRVSSELAQAYFDEATLYLSNDDPIYDANGNVQGIRQSIVTDVVRRLALLNMITAHIAALNAPDASGSAAPPIVGQVTDVKQGSIEVKAEPFSDEAGQWWASTQYGIAFWQAVKRYRTATYIPGPRRVMTPPPGGLSYGARW